MSVQIQHGNRVFKAVSAAPDKSSTGAGELPALVPDRGFLTGTLPRIWRIGGQVPAALSLLGGRLTSRLTGLVREELEFGSAFGFAPVALGVGIVLYFTVMSEPRLPVVAFAFIACAVITFGFRVRGTAYYCTAAAALVLLGMLVAQMHSSVWERPVIARQVTGQVDGVVIATDASSRGRARYLIRPLSIDGLSFDQLPSRIRLSIGSRSLRFEPGDSITGTARISPFSGPAVPGGFDFGFSNWFEGLGGTGYFLGSPARPSLGTERELPLGDRLSIRINNIRMAIAQRILRQLPGESGATAVALIFGDRSRKASGCPAWPTSWRSPACTWHS